MVSVDHIENTKIENIKLKQFMRGRREVSSKDFTYLKWGLLGSTISAGDGTHETLILHLHLAFTHQRSLTFWALLFKESLISFVCIMQICHSLFPLFPMLQTFSLKCITTMVLYNKYLQVSVKRCWNKLIKNFAYLVSSHNSEEGSPQNYLVLQC